VTNYYKILLAKISLAKHILADDEIYFCPMVIQINFIATSEIKVFIL
jgi:hypothetical protein